MNTSASPTPVEFAAPGPGSWSIDTAHFPRPVSHFQAEIHPQGITEGFTDCAPRYGLLIDTLDFRFINGFGYSTVVPAPETEIPARFKAAEAVFRDKIWRDDLERWDREVKPASIETHQALLAVEPEALSDQELFDYVTRCRENLQAMVRQHHMFNLAAMIPVGDFMAHVERWSPLPVKDYLTLTQGSAPESAGIFHELDDLAEAIRGSEEARGILGSDAPGGTILDRLRDAPGAVGETARTYLDMVGHRLLNSLDTGEPAAIEVPDALVSRIRLAVDQGVQHGAAVSADEAARLRAAIPPEHRETYDGLLEEVLRMWRLRDERGFYSDVWAGGVMRRALLAAGKRLAAEGRIAEPENLAEGTWAEIQDLLRRNGGPSAETLAARADYRRTHRAEAAPPELGDPPAPPPPLDGLPPDVVRVMTAIGTAIMSLNADPDSGEKSTIVKGIGASPGTYTGTARVIDGPDDLRRLQRGDVLIAATTTDSFNIVLPLLGGIVTNAGGLLSHAAIVGREYGIPSVVGTRNATAVIADGARVTVNGSTGEVEIAAA
ncbi:PEP-utilizing enzyme [Aestuariicoccus sp. MJ-SS9]|uniref:PEP-utilizing enzyme n=1 Tax=Aestuariicoccus sp. MJ-SS9 TaxID=3079855 RepID=UPI00290E1A8B|nr:PEP-utilizing enzyme [Aestuariicoccus sp. MJ-SS9]MDU8913821.1 PEP-utilizing enzyme [Aestuariicoccus sp. MJ-SS9]